MYPPPFLKFENSHYGLWRLKRYDSVPAKDRRITNDLVALGGADEGETLTVGGVELIGEPSDVETVDNVSRRHRDADERRRRHERLPAWKRAGDGEDGVR